MRLGETARASLEFSVIRRPRWHDALIIAGIAGLLGLGIWALWWDDVRDVMGWERGSADELTTPTATPNT
jgi:hypothetical protein